MYSSTISLTLALDVVSGQRHVPAALPLGMPRYPLYNTRLGGPQGRPGRLQKFSSPPRFHPRTVQPVASLYTDWAIPTHSDEPNSLYKCETWCSGSDADEDSRSLVYKTFHMGTRVSVEPTVSSFQNSPKYQTKLQGVVIFRIGHIIWSLRGEPSSEFSLGITHVHVIHVAFLCHKSSTVHRDSK